MTLIVAGNFGGLILSNRLYQMSTNACKAHTGNEIGDPVTLGVGVVDFVVFINLLSVLCIIMTLSSYRFYPHAGKNRRREYAWC